MKFFSRTPLSREDVARAFRDLLGREPESEHAVAYYRSLPSLRELYTSIASSAEYREKSKPSPYFHFNAAIDVPAIIAAHDNPEKKALAGHIVNFLGVAMDVRFMPTVADRGGVVEEAPIPGNYHADMAEWAAALRAVDLARESFTIVELGCGWGCWMVNTSVAARRRGLRTHAIGVEGDPGHVEFARQALAANGIGPDAYELHRGIASARPGTALFPKQKRTGSHWGLQPSFDAGAADRERALASGKYVEVAQVPLGQVVAERPRIDLLHMDIQGGEAALVRECLDLLREKVAYLVIGTHSRVIEGELMSRLLDAGWALEVERPAIFDIIEGKPEIRADGVQGWRNPVLVPMD